MKTKGTDSKMKARESQSREACIMRNSGWKSMSILSIYILYIIYIYRYTYMYPVHPGSEFPPPPLPCFFSFYVDWLRAGFPFPPPVRGCCFLVAVVVYSLRRTVRGNHEWQKFYMRIPHGCHTRAGTIPWARVWG